MNANNLKQAVLSTTAFFDLFDFALGLDELEQYLYGPFRHERGRLASYIKGSPKLILKNAVFCLSDRRELAELREKRNQQAEEMWQKANKICQRLSFVPFLRAVCVCNNLAYNNVREGSDIDLFIIAKKGRLFLVRTLVTLITHLSGMRRHGQKIAGRVCLSFFVSEEGLNLEKIALQPFDIYLAYWIKTLKPVVDRGVMGEFEQENERFMKDYFPGRHQVNRCRQQKIGSRAQAWADFGERVWGGFWGNLLEKILKGWQMRRAEKKRQELEDASGIVLSQSMLKFHNHDRRQNVNKRWMERLKGVLA